MWEELCLPEKLQLQGNGYLVGRGRSSILRNRRLGGHRDPALESEPAVDLGSAKY